MSTYLTVRQLAAKHPAFTEKALRNIIFYENHNGFHTCVRRVGRKVLINEPDFITWVESAPPSVC